MIRGLFKNCLSVRLLIGKRCLHQNKTKSILFFYSCDDDDDDDKNIKHDDDDGKDNEDYDEDLAFPKYMQHVVLLLMIRHLAMRFERRRPGQRRPFSRIFMR